MKKILGVHSAPGQHWVGDGFPVRSLFSYNTHAEEMSPFLLLDYAGPRDFAAAEQPRGVGQHPHRGFETVTIVYQGEVEHRDSTGGGGKIGPGEVQWMTAGGGLLHEEFHSQEFTRTGGAFEVVQLWVNLPASDKMTEPGYQAITRDAIPAVDLPGDAGAVRVIAGEYAGKRGPARTFTPMQVWDVRIEKDRQFDFDVPEGWTTAVVVLHGTVLVNDSEIVREAQFVTFDRSGTA
ncbi:MAG TPA: pirin family protein, partial [Woeseiaceae bacterium]|nr:pirin family protein [Woeseiaceae bacterium]